MESIVLSFILPAIEELLKVFGAGTATTSTVGIVIQGLEVAIPALTKLGSNLLPKIKNIIAVVSADPATTAAQLAQLQALDAASDAAFDAAVANAEAEDAQGG